MEITGIDVSQERLDIVPDEHYTKTVLGGSADMPLRHDAFDVVVMGELVEHLSFDEVVPTLQECHRGSYMLEGDKAAPGARP